MNLKPYLMVLLLGLSTTAFAEVFEYSEPRIEGLRMDRCLTWGEQCDLEAASRWCQTKSYKKAVYWEFDYNVATKEPTKMLVSKQICNQPQCDAFKLIVCYKPS